jgi:hypothetical protein
MGRPTIENELRELILTPDCTNQRTAFHREFGARFDQYFVDLQAALSLLRHSSQALPLYLFDILPPGLVAPVMELTPEHRGMLAKEMVSRQLDSLGSRLLQSALPEVILEQYPTVVRYMVRSIVDDSNAAYGDIRESYFDRDLRMAAGLSVPAGAQILDLRCWVQPSFYRNQGFKENLRCLSFIKFTLGDRGPMVRIHTDTRCLDQFNEEGWDDCYLRIAQLMGTDESIRGMIGTSWFYDPQLETVSPKLFYLARTPLGNGGFLRVDGPGAVHTARAITRSPTRKRMFDEGSYLPVCATLIWPRKSLLAWADAKKRSC